MVPLGDRGPVFRPEQDYFSVALVAVHLPGRLLNTAKFAPIIWSSVKHPAPDGERMLIGLFPSPDAARPAFARNDRVQLMDYQLTPRIIAREELTVDFTLGAVKEKDFLAGALGLVNELIASPAAAFVSQIAPAAGPAANAVKAAAQTAERIHQQLDALLDGDKLQALGRFAGTLRAPLPSGLIAFTEEHPTKPLRFDPARNLLLAGDDPVKSPWAVLRLACEAARPDWMALPDLVQAWTRIREAALNGGDILGAIEFFRVTAVTSPDLTREDAQRIVEAVRQKFAPVLTGAETSVSEDPGAMQDALGFFMGGAESMTLASPEIVRAADAMLAPGLFLRVLDAVLAHEGGYADHPGDPGGATNKGVTQAIYDDYRKRRGVPKRSVKDIEAEEVQEIYFQGYWRPAKCTEMPSEALALMMLDAAVNHGPRTAVRLLQQAAGVPDAQCDGTWGPTTRGRVLAASANAAALVEACFLRRERYYRDIVRLNPKLGSFLRGWMNRLVTLRAQVTPLLAGAPAAGETETSLFAGGAAAPLVAAEPDFSEWAPPAAAIEATA